MQKGISIQEGYNTTKLLFFNKNNFSYLRSRIEYYLMTDVETWFMIKEGFNVPTIDGEVLKFEKWTTKLTRNYS